MSHHSNGPFADEMWSEGQSRAEFERAFGKLGATGQFPRGKLTENDEGEIRIAIGQKDGKVLIDFGKPVAWIGFSAEEAEQIATTLREHAIECRLRRISELEK